MTRDDLTKDEADFLAAMRACSASSAELAGPDLSVNMVEKARKGEAFPSVPKFRAMLRRLRRRDPEAAFALLVSALGMDEEGYVVTRAAHVRSSAEVDREVFEAAAAAGELAGWRARRGPVEEGVRLARVAEREAVEAKRALEAMIPQPALALGGVR